MKLLVLATARDEFTAPITGDFRLEQAPVPPLDASQSREVLLTLLPEAVFPKAPRDARAAPRAAIRSFSRSSLTPGSEPISGDQAATPDEAGASVTCVTP